MAVRPTRGGTEPRDDEVEVVSFDITSMDNPGPVYGCDRPRPPPTKRYFAVGVHFLMSDRALDAFLEYMQREYGFEGPVRADTAALEPPPGSPPSPEPKLLPPRSGR